MKIFLFVLLSITFVSCLYEHQIGENDWNKLNIGELKQLFITNDKIYFEGENGQFGSLFKSSGVIEKKNPLQENKKCLWNSIINSQIDPEQYLVSDDNSLFFYNFKRKTFNEFNFNIKFDSEVVDYIQTENDYLILTQNSLYSVKSNSMSQHVTLGQDSSIKFVKLIQSEQKLILIYTKSNNDVANSICSVSIKKTALDLSTKSISQIQDKACHKIQGYNSNNFMMAKSFAIYQDANLDTIYLLDYYSNSHRQILVGNYASFSKLELQVLYNSNILVVKDSVKQEKVSNLYKFDESKYDFVIINHFTDSSYYFMEDQGRENPNEIFYLEQKENLQIILFKLEINSKIGIELRTWTKKLSKGAIKKAWMRVDPEKVGYSVDVLIQDCNLQFEYYSQSHINSIWSRDEQLAYIEGVQFFDYSYIVEQQNDQYYESLDNFGKYNPALVIKNFVLRVTYEVKQGINFGINIGKYLYNIVKKLIAIRKIDELSQLNKFSLSNVDNDIQYSLRQIIVAATKSKIIYGLDSKNGEILWMNNQVSAETYSGHRFVGIYNIIEKVKDHSIDNCFVVYSNDEKVIFLKLNPLLGTNEKLEVLNISNLKTIIEIKDKLQVLLLVDKNFQIYTYPNQHEQSLMELGKQLFFYQYDKDQSQILGYMYQNSKLINTWSLNVPKEQKLLQISSCSSQGKGPKVAIYDDIRVILKHIDNTNFAFITVQQDESKKQQYKGLNSGIINLYIVNGKTGRILYNHFQKNVELSLPINLLYDENSVFVTYFNQMQVKYEIWVVESFSNTVETSVANMLQNYYFQNEKYEYNNYIDKQLNIQFIEQKYGFFSGIKGFSVIDTKQSLTRRNLIVITTSNQIYSLDRYMISPRRATQKIKIQDSPEYMISLESTNLPPYMYLLPQISLNMISYNLDLQSINQIKCAPTKFESTTLMFSYGSDIFFNKVNPEKTFDMLNEDFNYIFLIATVILINIAVFLSKKMAISSRIFKIFHK